MDHSENPSSIKPHDDNKNDDSNDTIDSSQTSFVSDTDVMDLVIDDTLLDSFCYIKGRRYQKSDYFTYFLPNDEEEADRLNLQHLLFRIAWKENFSSPMYEKLTDGNAKVLDVGCGTGKWLLDMAEDYPDSTFIGVDISPLFPESDETPPNVGFLQCNVNDGLPFPDSTFDFVYLSCMMSSVTIYELEGFVKEMIRVVKPGGYIEIFEMDLNYENAGPISKNFMESARFELESRGICPYFNESILPIFQSVPNLKDIHGEKLSIPLGNWGGKIGEMMSKYYKMTFGAFKLFLTTSLGLTDEQYDGFRDYCLKEWTYLNHRAYTNSYRLHGRKSI